MGSVKTPAGQKKAARYRQTKQRYWEKRAQKKRIPKVGHFSK